jgi:hypothetical protein
MPTVTNQRTDDELWVLLDAPKIWIVRGGLLGVMGVPGTLRSALAQAHYYSQRGQSPGPIVMMPDDEIVIEHLQIYKLWERLGFPTGPAATRP